MARGTREKEVLTMKTMLLILFLILPASVMAQGESKELSLKLHITIAPTLNASAKDVGAFLDKELARRRKK